MFITITTSKATPDQSAQVEEFLKEFLPRMEKQPGVLAIYHYNRPEKGDESTIVIWEDQESVKAYREGGLIKEAIAFEKQLGLEATTREGYPLVYSSRERR